MKICFVGPSGSIHLKKLASYFSANGNEVHIVSFEKDKIENTAHHYIQNSVNPDGGELQKFKYLLSSKKINKIVKEIEPDVLSVHYASGYGIPVAFSLLKNYVLSVWGSDIFHFPRKGPVHYFLLKHCLNRASAIFSTSYVMLRETQKYTKKPIYVTPFGVDINLFTPHKQKNKKFVMGTIKTIQKVYGIDVAIKAIAEIHRVYPDFDFVFKIAGRGKDEAKFKELASRLGVSQYIEWLGYISQEEAAKVWGSLDLALIPSRRESFGVSALEAQACEVPLIISNAPGLLETTLPGLSSLVFGVGNYKQLAYRIMELVNDKSKREYLGKNGREYVVKEFDNILCLKRIEKLYQEVLLNE